MISMAGNAVVCVFLLIVILLSCQGTPTYYNVWPLGERTCGYDVEQNKDAIQPKLDSCLIHLGYMHVYPLLSYRPLALDGTMFLDLNSSALGKEDFTIKIHFRPLRLQGTLFHLQSQCTGPSCMTSLHFSLMADGRFHIIKTVNGAIQSGNFQIGVLAQAGKWSYLGVGVDVSSCKLKMRHAINNPSDDENPFCSDEKQDSGNGACNCDRNQTKLRVGGKWDDTDAFEGDFTCASVESEADSQFSSEIAPKCRQHLPNSQVPNFGLRPVHVFPLYNGNAGFDIIRDRSFRRSQDVRDWRPSATPVPALLYGSLHLDGSAFSTVDLALPDFSLQRDFIMAFYVKQASASQGTLAHVATIPAAGAGVGEIYVGVNQTHVEAVFKNGAGEECSHVVVLKSSWPDMTWGVVAVGRKGSSAFLVSKDQTASGDVTCSGAAESTGLEVALRLGGSLDDEKEGFHGNMACLAVFNVSVMSASLVSSSTLNGCNKTLGMMAESVAGAAWQSFYRFSVVKANARPLTSLLPSLSGPEVDFGPGFPSRSLTACAKNCALRPHCRSFAMSKVKGRGKGGNCQLFDFLTRTFLETAPGTHYFAMTVVVTLN